MRQTLGLTQPPVPWVLGLLPSINWLGHGIDHMTPSNAEVKERVELNLYSPSGTLWPIVRWALPFLLC